MNFTARQAVEFVQRYGADIIADRFIPFLLMIVGFFPITVSLVIALESFAGEAERGSIEPLLSSPLEDWQLYLGKLLASLITPVVAAYLGIITYLIGVYRTVGWTAEPIFLLQIVLLTTVQALVMISGAIVISTQATSVRAANLLSSFIVIPMALLIQGESIIMFWGTDAVLWWVILGQTIISILLVRMGLAHFSRENLLGRELDALDVRQNIRIFKESFVGQARSLGDWFKHEVPASFRRLGAPALITAFFLGVGLFIGMQQAIQIGLPPELLDLDKLVDLDPDITTGLRAMGLFSLSGAAYIVFHNLRVMLLATFLGLFSFGVLGIMILMLPMVLLGFLAQTAAGVGISPWSFLAAFVLPHGLLEIPAIILSGAVILRAGATVVTPGQGESISEAWLRALADGARVALAVILPLFILASLLEVFITPRTMFFFLGQ